MRTVLPASYNTMSTTTLAPVTATQSDLFNYTPAARAAGEVTQIVSRSDATKVLGRKITFDAVTLKEFKDGLNADKTLTAAAKKEKRQQFLHADAIKQRQLLGEIALRQAYEKDEFAPMGRVPDTMELRKNGTIKLISIESFIGKAKTETPAQKIERLERELREARANAIKPVDTEVEVITVVGDAALEA